MRYLPSVIFFATLLAFLILADRQKVDSLERVKRDAADVILSNVQSQFNGVVSRAIRSSRRLASRIDPAFDTDQSTFEALLEESVSGPSQLHRAELAPGFVTQLVYPVEGNQAFIGKSPLSGSSNDGLDLDQEISRGFPVLKRIEVSENGEGELQVQAEIREASGQEIVSVGMVSLVARFALTIAIQTPNIPDDEMEFLVLSQPAGSPLPELPREWQQRDENRAPILQTMHYPPGDFLLFLRPIDNWRPMAAEMTVYRLQLAGLGLLLLVPVVLANWIAVSYAFTRSTLTQTKDQMGGLLRNLHGAALTINMPADKMSPGSEDKIRFLNPDSCRDIWGIEANIVERDSMTFWQSLATPEAADKLKAAIIESTRTLRPLSQVFPIRTPSGEQKWLLGRGNPTKQADGSIIWSTLILDNTVEIEAQKELELQRELAFRAQKNESIGHLTGGVAHDFNNLLAVILGNLESLSDEELDTAKREKIKAAIQATIRGADLTRSMLTFAGRARLSPEALKLNEVLVDARSWIERTLPATISVQFFLADDLWTIFADRSSSESAILNLILNARDAMGGRGCLKIETANITVDHETPDAKIKDIVAGRYVLLKVSDTGHGIPEDQLQAIFEPFFTSKDPGKGSGLGLSMVKGFIKQTGGAVRVESRDLEGTTFKLYFPVSDEKTSLQPRPTGTVSQAQGGKRRILLAEDNDAVRDALVQTLLQAGHSVIATRSGDEAFEKLKIGSPIDLLITDIVMQGNLLGTDLAEVVREQWPNLPVILLSGYAEKATIDDKNGNPRNIKLIKPVRRADLLAAIEDALNQVESLPS